MKAINACSYRARRLWYGSTKAAVNFVSTGRHIRTIGPEKLPRDTKTAFNRANGLRNSSVGEPLKG